MSEKKKRDIKKDPFNEYIKNVPPTRKELGQAWQKAIGLQDVDGLKPSEYLYETAKKNIDGEISIDEAGKLINSYYESKSVRLENELRTEEADKVSARIARILSDNSFTFSPTQYISIHRELLWEYIRMQERFVIIIFQRKSGFLMETLYLMVTHRI